MEVEDMAKKIVNLESECDRWKVEKLKLKEQMMEVKVEEARMKKKYKKTKRKYVDIREEFNSEKQKWREENEKVTEKYWELEVIKRELTVDLEAALSQQRVGDEGAAEAEIERLKSSLEEKDGEIKTLLGKIEDLDRQKPHANRAFRDKMTMEAKKTKREDEKYSKLIEKIQALERDKEKMAAEVSKLRKEKREEVGKSFIHAKNAVQAEKKRLEKFKGKHFELAKKIGEYEREKKLCKMKFPG